MADNRYRQLCFNELTVTPECDGESEAFKRIKNYAETIKAAKDSLETKMIRYESVLSEMKVSGSMTLQEFCSKHKREPWVILIMSTFTMPHVNPEDAEQNSRFESVEVKAYSRSSRGLASAYVYQTAAVGFNSGKCWDNVIHDIEIVSETQTDSDKWPCLTSPAHVNDSDFLDWKASHEKLSLQKSKLKFEEKKVSLRDDHGKDELLEHAAVLCRNEYVDGVLTSLSFKGRSKTYIDKVYPDGLIDVVLFRSEKGYSMRVKTTGRNIHETNAIAEKLKKLY